VTAVDAMTDGPITGRRRARESLAAAGMRPRKRFGQHFLVDRSVVRRIVAAVHAEAAPAVLEIGPGLGALTESLVEAGGPLYLVELDRDLAARLTAQYADVPHVRVVEGDVVEVPLDDVVSEPTATVVGNLPYNVSTPILFRLLALRARFPRAIVMLQREVAMRIAARPGGRDWGVLSVSLQTHADVRVLFRVKPGSFLPPPKVESAVVELRWSPSPRVDVGDPALHVAVVRAAFGQRRKMLHNALQTLGCRVAAIEAALADAGIDPRARAETLDLDAFGRLARAIAAHRGA
jgi:16S rRNA (adenine1518-N6/adenine1519-N6)-dimethyltransferase